MINIEMIFDYYFIIMINPNLNRRLKGRFLIKNTLHSTITQWKCCYEKIAQIASSTFLMKIKNFSRTVHIILPRISNTWLFKYE